MEAGGHWYTLREQCNGTVPESRNAAPAQHGLSRSWPQSLSVHKAQLLGSRPWWGHRTAIVAVSHPSSNWTPAWAAGSEVMCLAGHCCIRVCLYGLQPGTAAAWGTHTGQEPLSCFIHPIRSTCLATVAVTSDPFGYMAETGINFSFHSLSSQSTVLASVWVWELTKFNVLVHLYPQN